MNLKTLTISNAELFDDGKTIEISMPLSADKVVQINFTGLRDHKGRSVSVDKVYYTLNHLVN